MSDNRKVFGGRSLAERRSKHFFRAQTAPERGCRQFLKQVFEHLGVALILEMQRFLILSFPVLVPDLEFTDNYGYGTDITFSFG